MGLLGYFRLARTRKKISLSFYNKAVEYARSERFYTIFSVPDTLDGRFDMTINHVYLIIRWLRSQGSEGKKISQELLDLLLDDMDQNLREMGVSDLGVGRQVKNMAKAFYGRSKIIEDGLQEGKLSLENGLKQILYRSNEPSSQQISKLAEYLMQAEKSLKNITISSVFEGKESFPFVVPENIDI